MRQRMLLVLCCLAAATFQHASCAGKGASVTLSARWAGTSYLLEAAEMLAAEDPPLFWRFLDAATAAKEPADEGQCWAHVLGMAADLLPSSTAQLAPLILSSRQYSAKVEMNRQLAAQLYPREAEQSCCFADVGGHLARSPAELATAIEAAQRELRAGQQRAQAQLFEVDHVYGGSRGSEGGKQITAVLYGPIGGPCTRDMHAQLSRQWQQSQQQQGQVELVYALRPVLSPSCQAVGCAALGTGERVLLPGYGVEAVLKDTEYSAMDEKDRGTEGDSTEEEEGVQDAEQLGQIEGLDFDTLIAEQPHRRAELLTLRDLLTVDSEDEAVKVLQLKDIGLQAMQRIMQGADPLRLLADVSQNFPSLVSSLSRQRVNSTIRSSVTKTHQHLPPGFNFMLVNGLAIDINEFDLYGFMDRLRSEMRLLDSVRNLGLPANESVELLQLRTQDSSGSLKDLRLDLGLSGPRARSSAPNVVFINNLEKDKMYTMRLSSSVMDVLNTFPGRLRPMAINAYVFVLVVDPASPEGMAFSDIILQMWEEMFPLRMGVTFNVPAVHERLSLPKRFPFVKHDMAPKWSAQSTSERLARAFLTIDSVFGGPASFNFWSLASQGARERGGWEQVDSNDVLRSSFTAAWSAASQQPLSGVRARTAAKKLPTQVWEDLVMGSGYASEVGMRLVEMCQWQETKGIARSKEATGWLNGQQVVFKDVVDGAVQQELLYMMVKEQSRLQELVFYGAIADDDDVQDILVTEAGAVGRWNPDIMAGAAPQVLPLGPLLQHPDNDHAPIVFALPAPQPSPQDRNKAASNPKKAALMLAGKLHPATHIVVACLGRQEGREQLAEALRYLVEKGRGADRARVVLILNPPTGDSELTLLEVFVHAAVAEQHAVARKAADEARSAGEEPGDGVDMMPAAKLLLSLLQDTALATALSGPITKSSVMQESGVVKAYADKVGMNGKHLEDFLLSVFLQGARDEDRAFVTPESLQTVRDAHARLARDALGILPGASAVITNGRVYHTPSIDDPQPAQQALAAEDLVLVTLTETRFQPASAMASVLAGAFIAGKLEGSVPTGGGMDTVKRLDDLLAGVSAATGAAAALPGSMTEGGTEGSAKVPQMPKELVQVINTLSKNFIQAGPDPGSSPSGLHITCVLDPLTRAAQRMSQVLLALRDTELSPSISLLLNPLRDLKSLPLKSYYRFVLPELSAAQGSSYPVQPKQPHAYFHRLPSKRILTLNMDVPEAWLVEATQAAHDVDNMRLADLEASIAHTEFELDALMLTGSCVDVTKGATRMTPPRGLQLHLGTVKAPHLRDTLVMSNLAYFQLKAAPGMWQLSLAPGRTQEVYVLQPEPSTSSAAATTSVQPGERSEGGSCSAGQAGSASLSCGHREDDLSTQVVVSSLAGKHMVLRVRKRPGKEQEDVLKSAGEVASAEEEEEEEEDDVMGMADYEEMLLNLMGEEPKKKPPPKPPAPSPPRAVAEDQAGRPLGGDVINVFTVASGHMYERLQKIMVLSVIKNTKSRVKFWFIKNYMSPQHKQVLPAMAAHYGFDYEFVTYKWPNWLHKQTDKQRIIWAYKILFLDVLFPLGVERIIFVDSDQVVRTDLAELYHMDIQGKPYAYTPFCDSNKDTEEFRFWKGGFWSQHLRGKPYHISALYLVDLKRFRAMAAGDQLRVVYDQLSRDPNSLSNLDQDLPNYVQHSIPIFSLPKEWLWCESWCGDATKAKAKTIDLCNNPKTKEPKLAAARRIIAEWPGLDAEQAEFTKHAEAQQLGVDSVDVNGDTVTRNSRSGGAPKGGKTSAEGRDEL